MIKPGCLLSALILLAVMPSWVPAAPDDGFRANPVGVCTHLMRPASGWDTDEAIRMMKTLGISIVRDEFADWATVEKEKGVYEIPSFNLEVLRKLNEAGIEVILVLDYINPLYQDGIDADAYAKYAAYVARRLRGTNVIAYELWNEPHNFHFRSIYGGEWNGKGDCPWLTEYAKMVAKASAAIRSVDQNVKILAGAGNPAANGNMLVNHTASLRDIDGLSIHPYTFSMPPETIPFGGEDIEGRDGVSVADANHSMVSLFERLRALSREHAGRELELWTTEFGYTTFNQHAKDAQRGLYAGFTEEAQAAYHTRAILLALASGVKAWCIYDLIDEGGDPIHAEENFGLFHEAGREYQPKPVAACIANISALIRNGWTPVAPMGEFIVDSVAAGPGDTWQVETPDAFIKVNGPQVVWLSTPDANLAFVWMAGRIDVERNPPLARITLPNRHGISGVKCYDLSNNEELDIEAVQEGDSVNVNNIPVRYMPCVVKWPRQ